MKNEITENEKDKKKEGEDTYIYAVILFGAIVITGLIALAYIVLRMF